MVGAHKAQWIALYTQTQWYCQATVTISTVAQKQYNCTINILGKAQQRCHSTVLNR